MRAKIIAGNWKMNKKFSEAKDLLNGVNQYLETNKANCEVIVAPPFIYLENASKYTTFKTSAQDVSEHISGAYTGEISVEMLQSIQVKYTIIGHSERRQYHQETDEKISVKIKKALQFGVTPIYCNGELLEDRKAGKHFEIVKKQTETALFGLKSEEIKNIIIAYEPVWAIGTGETATPEQAQEMHAFIRNLIADKYGKEIAEGISILYGGSVKPSNAKEIFSKTDVDGGLIGGASLNIEDFTSLIAAYS